MGAHTQLHNHGLVTVHPARLPFWEIALVFGSFSVLDRPQQRRVTILQDHSRGNIAGLRTRGPMLGGILFFSTGRIVWPGGDQLAWR